MNTRSVVRSSLSGRARSLDTRRYMQIASIELFADAAALDSGSSAAGQKASVRFINADSDGQGVAPAIMIGLGVVAGVAGLGLIGCLVAWRSRRGGLIAQGEEDATAYMQL